MRRLGLIILLVASPSPWGPQAAGAVGRAVPLIWVDGASPEAGQGLFPHVRVEAVAKAITGAEQTVPDAVLFGPGRTAAAQGQVAQLLAGGAVVIVQSDERPPGPWTWERTALGWQTTFNAAGPHARLDGRVYDAFDGRPVGRSLPQRHRTVLLAGLSALAILGASLAVRHRAVWAAVGVALCASVGLVIWANANPTVVRDRVTVVVTAGRTTQVDEWTYERAPQRLRRTAEADDLGRPVLRSARHERDARLTAEGGRVTFDLAPGLPMALLRRELRAPVAAPTDLTPVPPGLRPLAALYAAPTLALLGVQRTPTGGAVLWVKREERKVSDAR